MLLNCSAGEDFWESLGQQGDQSCQILKEINTEYHWKDWCWRWSSSPSATWCEEPTPWWRQEKGMTEDEMAGWHHRLWTPLSAQWRTRKPGMLQVHGVAKSWTWLSEWTTTLTALNVLKTTVLCALHYTNNIIVFISVSLKHLSPKALTALCWTVFFPPGYKLQKLQKFLTLKML